MAQDDQAYQLRILFVCAANICRSPIAEAVFKQQIEQAGESDRVYVDSAGSALWQVGSPPHPRSIQALKDHGIDYDHVARLFGPDDLRKFDFILAMDNTVLRSIWAIGSGPAKIQPFVKYAPQLKIEQVDDPIRTGNFDACYETIVAGCQGFLDFLRGSGRL